MKATSSSPVEAARRHPLAAYFVLAFAITWLLVAPLVAQGVGLISGVPPGWHALGALGPMAAAFVVAGMEGGGAGAGDLLTRLTRWRVGAGWFLVAVFSPFLLFALSAVLVRVLGGSWPDLTRTGFGEIVGFSFLAGLLYGVGEETGWRGFVLPRLQRRPLRHGRPHRVLGALACSVLFLQVRVRCGAGGGLLRGLAGRGRLADLLIQLDGR
ncbi:MAG TPA: CPBP family glutamic-type intramembrane protease [Rubrobacteraceae bacterium]|nr:CPBP family glutamic-type intramembrane protease [Rubrobacteraceae bacterium]